MKNSLDSEVNKQSSMDKVNLIIIGDTSVGKTAILKMYAKNEQRRNYIPTIGVDFTSLNH